MSKHQRENARIQSRLVEVKSKFYAEFRRFALDLDKSIKFENFYELVEQIHRLQDSPFIVTYTDPEGDLLPINNDDNYAKAITTAKPLLKLVIQRQGEGYVEVNGYGTLKKKGKQQYEPTRTAISLPHDFRKVSAIIDVDLVPETHRRVKLMKNGSDKPLGFYIRDGTSVRTTHHGMEKIPGIFISRLVPGGLAESTGLLAVNDEVLEVNGIEVSGKTLDQVTDMMVANSANLIITVKPASQKYNLTMRGSSARGSQKSSTSLQSAQSVQSLDSDEIRVHDDDEDEVRDHLSGSTSNHANANNTPNSDSRESSATSRSSGRSSKSPPKDISAAPSTSTDAGIEDVNKDEVTL